jgi:hypothetical protein
MTIMLTCNCAPPTTTCSLEEALKNILKAQVGWNLVEVYTGDRASATDTANQGPKIPYVILSDLGPNNSRRLGENLVQHEVIVRLRVATSTDHEGLALARQALAAWRAAGQIETADGYACMAIPARSRPVKLDGSRWMVQVNQTFFIHTLIS